MKKSDLKILLLHNKPNLIKKLENINNELGLNVTYIFNNKESLKKKVKLTDYDIVILNENNSNFMPEYLEKNKNKFKLLINYEYQDYYSFYRSTYGTNIKLNCLFSDNKEENISFNILNDKDKIINIFRAILTSSINIYNRKLKELYNKEINDLDLKPYQEYNDEFKIVEKRELLKEEENLKLHKEFIEMTNLIFLYLYYKKRGYILNDLKGLKIGYDENGNIFIKNIGNYKILLDKEYKDYNIREFILNTYSNEGKLLINKKLAIYTDVYQKTNQTPPKPNMEEQLIIKEIMAKINETLTPILEEAVVYKSKIEKENKEKLKRKK